MKKYLSNDTATLIYKTMSLPYFDYTDVIINRANGRDTDKLQTLQNKCLRICLGAERRFSIKRAHKTTNVPFIKDRREAHVCNFMFKRKSKVSLLNRREIRTRAHDAPLCIVPVPRCESFRRSVSYHGSTLWNSLNVNVRNIGNYQTFKLNRKNAMLQPLTVM